MQECFPKKKFDSPHLHQVNRFSTAGTLRNLLGQCPAPQRDWPDFVVFFPSVFHSASGPRGAGRGPAAERPGPAAQGRKKGEGGRKARKGRGSLLPRCCPRSWRSRQARKIKKEEGKGGRREDRALSVLNGRKRGARGALAGKLSCLIKGVGAPVFDHHPRCCFFFIFLCG